MTGPQQKAGEPADPEANHPVLVRFGQRVRDLRIHADMTQEELAVAAGLHWTYISQIERGKRNLTYKCLLRLATGLAITISQLIEGQESNHDPGPFPDWDQPLYLS